MRRDGSSRGGAPSISAAPCQGQTVNEWKCSMCVTREGAPVCVCAALAADGREERRLILAQVREEGRRAEDGFDELKLKSGAQNKTERQDDGPPGPGEARFID